MVDRKSALDIMTIEISTHCDTHCQICPREKFQFKPSFMALDVFKVALQRCIEHWDTFSVDNRTIIFGGYGDPFLNKDFLEILRITKDVGNITVQTSTTCNCLNENRMKCMPYIDVLRVSFYGMSKCVYENVHRKGNFERAAANLNSIIAQKNRPYISMNFVVIDENEKETSEWVEHFEPLVEEIQVWKPHNWGGLYTSDRVLSHEAMMKAHHIRCFRIDDPSVVVRTTGDVVLCCFDINNTMVIGDVHTNTLHEMLNGDVYNKISSAFDTGEIENIKVTCRYCDQRTKRDDSLLYTSNADVKVGRVTNYSIK